MNVPRSSGETVPEPAVGPAPRRILLVDDNEMNADMLSRRLARRGFAVSIAVDGADGVAMALVERPDLVLMDMNLPVIDGWEAVRVIRRTPGIRGMPIIALTAHTGDEERALMLQAGCDEVEGKPIELPRLLTKMEALLTRGDAYHER